MTFNSIDYAIFLPLVLGMYWLLPHRGRLTLIALASYTFYGAWDWRFLFLLWGTSFVDYQVGKALARTDDEQRRKAILLTSLVVNLGALGFFKYAGFFVDSATSLLHRVGISGDPVTLRILLPVGISFYTFQSMAYVIDIYRRKLEPETDPLTYAAYVAFFPQLVAGPIERGQWLLPQLRTERPRLTLAQAKSGLGLIGLGLLKKVAMADAAAGVATRIFGHPQGNSSAAVLLGAYAFTVQIYGDFSGYTDIARGSARLLGVELIQNFDRPYWSRSITEFWQRWHISLSSWLRDYLYVPLGGNRGGSLRTYRNLMLTMLLGGLWHGAAWTFVLWGLGHGVLLAIERAIGGVPDAQTPWRPAHLLRMAVTFHLVVALWVLFRAADVSNAMDVFRGIVGLHGGGVDIGDALIVLWSLGGLMLLDLVRPRLASTWEDFSPVLKGVAWGATIVAVVVWSGGQTVPFIYFKF